MVYGSCIALWHVTSLVSSPLLCPCNPHPVLGWQVLSRADGSSSAITADSWQEKRAPRTGARSGQKTYTSDSGVSDAGTSTAGATGKVI